MDGKYCTVHILHTALTSQRRTSIMGPCFSRAGLDQGRGPPGFDIRITGREGSPHRFQTADGNFCGCRCYRTGYSFFACLGPRSAAQVGRSPLHSLVLPSSCERQDRDRPMARWGQLSSIQTLCVPISTARVNICPRRPIASIRNPEGGVRAVCSQSARRSDIVHHEESIVPPSTTAGQRLS